LNPVDARRKESVMKRNPWVAMVLCAGALVGWPVQAAAADRIVIGFGPSLTSALDIVAESQGFFAKEGLAAELREYARGNKAMEALFDGTVDLASSTAFPAVSNSFVRGDFRILTTVAVAGNDNKIIARGERGIRSLGDLKGKRIGVVKGGMSQYVLDLLLLQGGLSVKDITCVFNEPEPLLKSLTAGELDAMASFGSWFDKAAAALGPGAVVFTDESLVRVTTFMTAMESKLRANPGLFTRVIRAYIRAEEFIRANPDRSLDIVVERFKLDKTTARKLWKPNLFHVALDQSIIGDLENLARWQIDAGLLKVSQAPNFLDFIWFATLEEIDPKRVGVIH
jgi:ABC-type nitrate/sulfonate/bicarbonate transport system substrate-binding protein